MSREVTVTLLETVVLGEVVQVVPANDASAYPLNSYKNVIPLHLEGFHHTRQNTATDAHIASEGALLVNVVSVLRLGKLIHKFQIIYL